MFIVFEGIDGAGKTTISTEVARRLGYWWTREPTEWFVKQLVDNRECIETDPKCEARYFILDRDKHIPEILDHLLLGEGVVCDRYFMSTFAYSGAKGVSLDWLKKNGVPDLIPNITFLIDTPVSVAVERIEERGETADPKFLATVRENYLMLANSMSNVYILDGLEDVDNLYDIIYGILREQLPIRKRLRWNLWKRKY